MLELDAESVTSAISAAEIARDSVELVLQYLQSHRANMGKVRPSYGGGRTLTLTQTPTPTLSLTLSPILTLPQP